MNMKTLELNDRKEWRAWLAENHAAVDEIWLVFNKKTSGKTSLQYKEALDEALCFGWVDSLIKAIDEHKFARKFTPRKDESTWSLVNKKRVEELIQNGLMTEHGLRKVEAAQRSGKWDAAAQRPELDYTMPEAFSQALIRDPLAAETFHNFNMTLQKEFLRWIITAKRVETRKKRIEEAIQLLREGKKLGLR